jgi:hypothetical protein
MGMYDDEVTADNTMRKFEGLSRSAGDFALGLLGDVLGVGFLARLKELGYSTVEENIDFLGNAVQAELARIWKKLNETAKSVEEFPRMLASPEFEAALRSMILQTQRTTQKEKLSRMARLLANGIAAADLEPEGFDDMARAAVELKSSDIQILHDVLQIDNQLAAGADLFGSWHQYWNDFGSRYKNRTIGSTLSAFGRLESFGFVYGAQGTSLANNPFSALYRITDDGKRFLERIHDIDAS